MDDKRGIKETFMTYQARLKGLCCLYEDVVERRSCNLAGSDRTRQTNFERLVEGIAIQLALTWEIFTRDALLDSIVDYPEKFREREVKDPNWEPKARKDVEKVLITDQGKRFISFKNASDLVKHARDWIETTDEKKNPFLALDLGLVRHLNRFVTLRNHLVHRSSYSKDAFNKDFPGAKSPGKYLKEKINEEEVSKRYNQKYELGYFIEVFKRSLSRMAEAKSIALDPLS